MCLANVPGETCRASKAGALVPSLAGCPPNHRAAAAGCALLSRNGTEVIISLPARQNLARLAVARAVLAVHRPRWRLALRQTEAQDRQRRLAPGVH